MIGTSHRKRAGSLIDGTLRNTIDGADLYLFNPRGFFFSRTSSLDLHGSLYLSSATTCASRTALVSRVDSDLRRGAERRRAERVGLHVDLRLPERSPSREPRNLAVPLGETLSVVGGPVIASGLVGTSDAARARWNDRAWHRVPRPARCRSTSRSLAARGAATSELGSVNVGPNAALDVSDRLEPRAGARPDRDPQRRAHRRPALTAAQRLRASTPAADAPDIDLETTRSILLRSAIERRGQLAREHARTRRRLRLASETIARSSRCPARGRRASDLRAAGSVDVTRGSLELSETSRLATTATGDATAGRDRR